MFARSFGIIFVEKPLKYYKYINVYCFLRSLPVILCDCMTRFITKFGNMIIVTSIILRFYNICKKMYTLLYEGRRVKVAVNTNRNHTLHK